MSDTLRCDLAIVGGGLIGLALARAAARVGFDVVVVDRDDPATHRDADFDGRVTSLAYGSHAMLDALHLWPALAPHAEPILDIRVADGASPLYLHFDHTEVGERPFGFMIENTYLRRALLDGLADVDGLTWLAPLAVEAWTAHPGHGELRLSDGRTIRASLVAAADGRGSALRQAAGIKSIAWRYPQTAIVATLSHELPHHGVAKEHFQPSGPFALLPMRDNRSSMVWTEREATAPAIAALDTPAFEAEVQARAGDHLGRIRLASRRWTYPLALHNAETYVGPRLALVGDAAHAMHPLAGQGLNLGLRDAAWLVEEMTAAARLGLDIGADQMLRGYLRARRWDALTMLVMTDGLNKLFSNDIAPVRLARDLGLGLVNRIAPAKTFFERRASAMSGDLPALMQGQLP
ncbi:MAG: UbiH/UbiF/VisC/COQ6 family ubiquinone biosynthesis hydroxylase [Alphaproteobacteria bacterium]